MPTYRLVVAYDGTDYAGWQRQPNATTVQELLERALTTLLGEPATVIGAGRTDAGVHARGQCAHLVLDRDLALDALVHGTNAALPESIRVTAADRMIDGFHAQRSARAKEYRYYLRRERVLSPLLCRYRVRLAGPLAPEALVACASLLPGVHDFTAFASSGGSHGQPRRRIDAAEWRFAEPEIEFRIRGEGFLRGMVRALVGTMLDVGRGRLEVEQFAELLEGRPRTAAGPTAPARGLVLESVDYDPRWFADPSRRPAD